MTRPGDPLQLPEEPTRRASARVHLASYETLEAFFADRRRTRRLHWAAVIAATVCLVLVAFWAGRVSATSREGQVIPSGSTANGGGASRDAETDPGLLWTPPIALDGPPAASSPSVAASAVIPPRAATVPPATSSAIVGEATWWDSLGHGLYAAIRPDLGRKGELAVVCGGERWHCLTLPIITTCACLGPGSRRVIDLSADAFATFAPLSRGMVRVTVRVLP